MLNAQIAATALSLPEEDRRSLAQQLIESLSDSANEDEQLLAREDVQVVIGRLEELASGRVRGLTEAEYLAALQ